MVRDRAGFSAQGTDNEQPHSSFDGRAASIVARRTLADGVELDLVTSFGRSHLNYPGMQNPSLIRLGDNIRNSKKRLLSPGVEFDLGVGDSRGIIASLRIVLRPKILGLIKIS